jgi:DNA-directed RNA polymerase subunit alpha
MEDVVQIILNLKQVRFRSHADEAVTVTLKAKGEGAVTGKDIKCPSSVEVVNPDQVIATLSDKKTELEMDIVVDRGLGYVAIETREDEEREIGEIAVDAIYTPVRRVNYEVENMRVGKRTDYDRITLEVITDGSISPEEAFQQSVTILVDQFSVLLGGAGSVEAEEEKETKPKKAKKAEKEEKEEE